jgi:hypothetical protein
MERVDAEDNMSAVTVITGLLMYTPNGWMSEAFEIQLPGSELAATHMFYSGTYLIDESTVTHQPRIHTNPEMVGQDLPRQFEIEGDRFTLIAGNPPGSARLVWERVLR